MNDAGEVFHGEDVVTALGLAWQFLIEEKSKLGSTSIRLINNNTASAILCEMLLKDKSLLPFIPKESLCLATAKEVLVNMNLLRCNEYDSSVSGHHKYLETLIQKYEALLEERSLYDEPKVLKEAVELLSTNKVTHTKAPLKCCYFNKPSMLEEKFVSLLGSVSEFPKPQNSRADYKFVKIYGVINEADYIAKKIIEDNIPLEDVEVICSSSIYSDYIEKAFSKRGLKYSFESGVTAEGLNTIQLYNGLIDWYLGGCKYRDLFNVMYNPIFAISVDNKMTGAGPVFTDGISYGIGWGKDRYYNVERSEYDISHNKTEYGKNYAFRKTELPKLGDLAGAIDRSSSAIDVFDLLYQYIESHKFPRNLENRYIKTALFNLRKSISAANLSFTDKADMLEYLRNELNSLSYRPSDEGSCAEIIDINKPACPDRKNIFVLGLSANEFKISAAESPVLGDDLKKALFGAAPCGNVHLAENAVSEAEEIVRNTLKAAPDEASITILSSDADVLRDSSGVASSALFEKLLKETGGTIQEEHQYYEITNHDVHVDHDAEWAGFDVIWPAASNPIERNFSKSTLDTLLGCPLRYHYQNELYINQDQYPDYDPSRWLAANESGTLVHKILELYANACLKDNTAVSETFDEHCAEFKAAVMKAAAEADTAKAAPNAAVRDAELEAAVNMAKAYLVVLHKDLHDNGWVVISCEEKISKEECVYSFNTSGTDFTLHFSGSVDRIDRRQIEDGSYVYRIADYKTGSKSSTSTKQHSIYAHYVSAKYGAPVEAFEYCYLKSLLNGDSKWKISFKKESLEGEIISSAAGESGMSEQGLLYEIFANHNYECLNAPDCKYCRYEDICLRKLKGE